MPGYDFANSPTIGQVATNGVVSYTWDGSKWAPTAAGATGVSSFNTRTGAVTLSSGDVTGALTYTPYNATNPSGYQTAAQVAAVVDGANYADNGGFAVNQRSYVSGTALAAGAYGHDRWKAGAGGATYTFAAPAGPSNSITITVGTLQQVIEGASLAGGTYTLSWTGTVQGRIGAGSYAASPVSGSVTAGTNTTIEFNTGTLSRVKFELGSVATPWVALSPQQQLAVCQRFYVSDNYAVFGYGAAGQWLGQTMAHPVMRAAPTITVGTPNYINTSGIGVTNNTALSFLLYAVTTATGAASFNGSYTASADL